MIRRPPRSTHCISSAASDVYKRQIQDKDKLVSAFKDLQEIFPLIMSDGGDLKKVNLYIDTINAMMMAGCTNIEQSLLELGKLEQQLDIVKSKDETEAEFDLELRKKNFNTNFLALENDTKRSQTITGMRAVNFTEKSAEIIYKQKYRVKMEFERDGWEKLVDVEVFPPEVGTDEFVECVEECVREDDLVPLWNYMYKHFA
eukprot:TRINITY_DN8842_c0_g1_i9.p1 TRINITY_DN8842_c0_g1~~TRINITY_DN8842_c0_g1_i9.p1  ORF type:complete len:208 (+),score=61.01 TRINITY_DN8842_c0_g1_i9:22-624(+)